MFFHALFIMIVVRVGCLSSHYERRDIHVSQNTHIHTISMCIYMCVLCVCVCARARVYSMLCVTLYMCVYIYVICVSCVCVYK